MKNQLFTLAAVLTASAALTGCSSEQLVENTLAQETATVGKSHVVIINATKPGNDDFTRAVEKDGGALKTKWVAGEVVYAYKNNDGGPVSVTLADGDINSTDNKKATLKFNFTGTFSVNDEIVLYYQKTKDSYGDYSGQDGTLEKISSDYDRMKATVTVLAVNPSGEILATSNADFKRQQAITKFTVNKKNSSDAFAITSSNPLKIEATAVDLTVTPESSISEVWVALPGRASDASPAEKTYKFETTADSKKYGVSQDVDLVNNKYYTATLNMGRDAQKLILTGVPTGVDASQPYGGSAVNVGTVTSGDASPEGLTSADYGVEYKKWNSTTNEWDDCDANEVKDAGKYKAVITGKGDYEGTLEQEFDITKTPEATVETAITDNTVGEGTNGTQGTNIKIVPEDKTVMGLTGAQIKAGAEEDITDPSKKSNITIESGDITPDTGWAIINEQGELETTGGGIVEVTISLPETANHAAATVKKKIYVKQSGIGGNMPDPTDGGDW